MTLNNLKTEYPLNVQAIIETALLVRDYKDGLKILEELQKEFGF